MSGHATGPQSSVGRARAEGPPFVRALKMMVNDHQKVVAAVGEKSNDESAAAEVRQWAANTLPMLRDHVSRAQEIQSQLESHSSRR